MVITGDVEDSARARLAAVRDVLHRHGLPAAERIDLVLQGSEREAQEFLISDELWGKTGSIVYGAGIASSWEAQRESGDAFCALGEWQIVHGHVNPAVTDWVVFFRQQRELQQLSGGEHAVRADRPRRVAVPWSVRDVWLGVLAVAVIVAAAWGLAYSLRALSLRPDLDLWVALFPTLFELLFLVPVWWFARRKYQASTQALGFARFKPSLVAVGFGLLIAFYVFNAFYVRLLMGFGLHEQTDLTPLLRELSSPWPLYVSVVLIAPFVEETFFRGFVFAGLRERYDWRWAAAISGALFAAAHLEVTFFIPSFLLGFLFAYLYQRSNSVWPGMIIHFSVNALACAVLYVQV
jgi:membrane protease YdiL (CAAX protease family)